jgi:pilus assembly protein CpaB
MDFNDKGRPDGSSCDGGNSRRGGWVDRCRRGDGLRRGADHLAVADERPHTMLIAQGHVPAGTSPADAVAKGLIASTQDAARRVPVRSLGKADEATGKLVAFTDIAPGEFVLASRFGATPLGPNAIQVPDGQVALSVWLSDPAGVGALVTPGSRIVIYDTHAPAANSDTAAMAKQTQVLLDDVLVIALGSTSLTPLGNGAPPANGAGQAQAATTGGLVAVALPPDTAVKLLHGIQKGILSAGLRGTDTKANHGQIVTDAKTFNN